MKPIWALYLFDWINITISFFNTIALLWLGLTVLLNAERRTWGTWAAGGGMVLGSVFFAGHTAIVARVIGTFSAEMEFWWWIGWFPFVSAPYLWYLVMVWYTGVLHTRRHRFWLIIISLLGIGALGLLLFANPIPTYHEVLQRSAASVLSIFGIPVVALVYPVYSTLCFVVALSALRHPAASERFMGDVARQRARPWLVGASLVLLGVSLSVGGAAGLFLFAMQSGQLPGFSLQALVLLITFDLFISGMIAVTTVLMGKAVVSYEVFTGKVLPRGGLLRHWRRSLILAVGYGGLMAASLGFPIPEIYRLLMATILMTIFFALISWRSYVGHERSIEQLRPFVASQRLYEHLLNPTISSDVDSTMPLRALCEQLLNARAIRLVVLGPLAPLVGPGLDYPKNSIPLPPDMTTIIRQCRTPQTLYVPLNAEQYHGAAWAVPLWSERGLIGVLLLADRRDGGLYTQEEMEIARATGERLIDTQASVEMAQRLMSLQRQRLMESQLLDQRTRRVLHDDVLPLLHTAMLLLGSIAVIPESLKVGLHSPGSSPVGSSGETHEAVALLTDAHQQISRLLRELPATVAPEVARMGVIGALQRAVERELRSNFDDIIWQIEPEAEQAVRTIPTLATEVIFYAAREAMRNAARYGRDGHAARPLRLTIAVAWRNGLELMIEDDGVGINPARSSQGGSGQGLALHSTMMAVIGGTLTVESVSGKYTRVVLALPAEWQTVNEE